MSDEKIQSAVTDYLTVNPVLPGATAEQAQQIEQNKTDIASLKTETNSLKEDLDAKSNQYIIDNFVRVSRSGNLLNYVTNIHDSEISTVDGTIIQNTARYCVSDFIPIGYNKKVVFSHNDAKEYVMTQVALYDLNKKFVKKIRDISELTLDNIAYFIRVCFKQNDEKVVQISYNTRLNYVPYQYIIEPIRKKQPRNGVQLATA